MKLKVEIGYRYNKLEVLKEIDPYRLPSGQTNRAFLCRCDCGKEIKARLSHLVRGKAGCQCVFIDGVKMESDNDVYIRKIYRAIKHRTSENYAEKHLYYDKGVKVCDEWLNDFSNFYYWAKRRGLKKGLQIDRIDSDDDYNPKNCRVVSPKVNANNKSNTFYVNYKGNKIAFMLLLQQKNLEDHACAIRGRIRRGWSVEEAIDKPIRKIYANKYL